jgi:hypothetical protein
VELETSCKMLRAGEGRWSPRLLCVDWFGGEGLSLFRRGAGSDGGVSGPLKSLEILALSRCDETLVPRKPTFFKFGLRFCDPKVGP